MPRGNDEMENFDYEFNNSNLRADETAIENALNDAVKTINHLQKVVRIHINQFSSYRTIATQEVAELRAQVASLTKSKIELTK
jgi:hypothetical protein